MTTIYLPMGDLQVATNTVRKDGTLLVLGPIQAHAVHRRLGVITMRPIAIKESEDIQRQQRTVQLQAGQSPTL